MPNTFISLVVDGLLQQAGGLQNLGSYTLVFPSQRAGLFLKEELKQRMLQQNLTRPILTPEIVTLDSLVSRLSSLQPADEIESIVLLYRIYTERLAAQGQPSLPLDVFYGWGRQLITDFDNADMALVNQKGGAAALFRNSVDAHQLEGFALDDETLVRLQRLFPQQDKAHEEAEKSKHEQFEQLWAVLPEIYTDFREAQRQQGKGTSGARMLDAIHRIEENPTADSYLSNRTVAFIGFNYLLHAERQLMKVLSEHTTTLFFWDYRSDFQTNKMAYSFMKKAINDYDFSNSLPAAPDSESEARLVTAISSVTTNAQAQYVHQWLRENADKPGTKAIVIADESLLEPVLYALPKECSGRVNITKGYPLRNTRVYGKVLSFLADHKREQLLKAGKTTLPKLLDTLISELEQQVWEARQWEEAHSPKTEDAATELPADRTSDEQTAHSWDYNLLQESYYQARLVLSRFRALIEPGKLLSDIRSLSTLRHLVAQHMGSVSMPFHGEPVTDIQVIGVLETRLLDFDHMLILNVEEGVVPRTPKDNSFIPYYLRKYYGMQTSDEETAIYAYNFFRLFRRCPDATVVYTNAIVDSSQKGMSRFLMQMMITPSEFSVSKRWISEPGEVSPADICMLENPAKSYLDYLQERDKEYEAKQKPAPEWKLSPSAINSYLGCHRRFFLEHVLRLNTEDPQQALFEINELGSLIHALLQKACEHITGLSQTDTVKSYPMTKAMIESFLQSDIWTKALDPDAQPGSTILDEAYLEVNSDYRKHHPGYTDEFYHKEDHPIENEVAMANAEKVLRNDGHALSLEIVEQERDRRIVIPVTLNGKTYSIKVGGKIDRLDIVTENGDRYLRILDYKTGTYQEKKMKADCLEQVLEDGGYMFQTLLYCLVCSESDDIKEFVAKHKLKIMPNLLYTRMGLAHFDAHLLLRGPAPAGKKTGEYLPILDFEKEIKSDFVPLLQKLLADILSDSEFALCDEKDCPNYCPFHQLCGRDLKPEFSK